MDSAKPYEEELLALLATTEKDSLFDNKEKKEECELPKECDGKKDEKEKKEEKMDDAPPTEKAKEVEPPKAVHQYTRKEYMSKVATEALPDLSTQQFALNEMNKFVKDQRELRFLKCGLCKRNWPTNGKNVANYKCHSCRTAESIFNKKEAERVKKTGEEKRVFSIDPNRIPSEQPRELEGLSVAEGMLIAKVNVVQRIYTRPGGQRAFSGHVISLEQYVQSIARVLPHLPSDLPLLTVRKPCGTAGEHKDFRVRKSVVENALKYLKQNNPLYTDIEISEHNLSQLPEDGNIVAELRSIPDTSLATDKEEPKDPAKDEDDCDLMKDQCDAKREEKDDEDKYDVMEQVEKVSFIMGSTTMEKQDELIAKALKRKIDEIKDKDDAMTDDVKLDEHKE